MVNAAPVGVGSEQETEDSALLLVPTRRLARERTEALLRTFDLPGLWGGGVTTFPDFIARLLQHEGMPSRLLTDLERRMLIEVVIADLRQRGTLSAIGAAAETRGFASHMMQTITQLKQAAIEPASFRACTGERPRPGSMDALVADVKNEAIYFATQACTYVWTQGHVIPFHPVGGRLALSPKRLTILSPVTRQLLHVKNPQARVDDLLDQLAD